MIISLWVHVGRGKGCEEEGREEVGRGREEVGRGRWAREQEGREEVGRELGEGGEKKREEGKRVLPPMSYRNQCLFS